MGLVTVTTTMRDLYASTESTVSILAAYCSSKEPAIRSLEFQHIHSEHLIRSTRYWNWPRNRSLQLAGGRKLSDGSARDFKGRLFIHDKQLKSFREHFSCKASSEVPPFVYEIASIKAAARDGLSVQMFLVLIRNLGISTRNLGIGDVMVVNASGSDLPCILCVPLISGLQEQCRIITSLISATWVKMRPATSLLYHQRIGE